MKRTEPELLATIPSSSGEECIVLRPENESTSFLVKARRLLTTCAIQELGMSSDELPQFKQPVRLTDPTDHAIGRPMNGSSSSTGEFNPYQGHRYDAKSAAIGKQLGPDAAYESTTEKQLQLLQNQQAKLEKTLHKPLQDRELVASLPGSSAGPTPMQVDAGSSRSGPSDGSLLASKMKRMQEERKQREEGGFTTKAMRDLQQMKKQKVYSHVQLRIQFPDASSLEAKFLPRETVAVVKDVVSSCFIEQASAAGSSFDFDLYIAPPRRLLDTAKSLQDEGLVPAAKVFLSWKVGKGPAKNAAVGSFLQSRLFRDGHQPTQAYPSAQSVAASNRAATKQNNNNNHHNNNKRGNNNADNNAPSREDDLLRRMMGGQGGIGRSSSKKSGGGGGKPKWFK